MRLSLVPHPQNSVIARVNERQALAEVQLRNPLHVLVAKLWLNFNKGTNPLTGSSPKALKQAFGSLRRGGTAVFGRASR
jgi:hypothetical protein